MAVHPSKERLDGALAEARARAEHGPTIPGNIEPGDVPGPSRPSTGPDNLGCPSVGRALRGRPPTRLHPTEQQMVVRGASVGLLPGEGTAADASIKRGRRGRQAKQMPRPANGGRASSAPPEGPSITAEVPV